jgi:hypothetical protein
MIEVAGDPSTDRVARELAALAARHRDAAGLVMRAVNLVGGLAENRLERLPDPVKEMIEAATLRGLRLAYAAAAYPAAPRTGRWANRVAVVCSGAAGGAGGLATAVVELPFTVATMFAALQRVAAAHGFDPADPAVRLECLQVFASGGPLADDDGVNTSFLASRVAVTGQTVHAALRAVVPRFAAALGQKLAAQTAPILGAAAGAGINLAFIRYYEEMAHVRFGLMRAAREVGEARARDLFARAVRDARRARVSRP